MVYEKGRESSLAGCAGDLLLMVRLESLPQNTLEGMGYHRLLSCLGASIIPGVAIALEGQTFTRKRT